MPNALDVNLVRAFVRPVGGTIAENTIKDNTPFESFADFDAGSALFGTGVSYKILGVVR